MIIVHCALRQEDIIKIVEDIQIESFKIFKYLKTDGIRIFFKCNYPIHGQKASSLANMAIEDTRIGKALFFNVVDISEYPWIQYPYY